MLAGAYGVVTLPFSVREGINVFLAGFIPTENLRFREEALSFKVAEQDEKEEEAKKFLRYKYPSMTKDLGAFKLTVEAGEFSDSEILVMLGENGMGKTTLIRLLAGMSHSSPNLLWEVALSQCRLHCSWHWPVRLSQLRRLLWKGPPFTRALTG